MAVVGPRLIDPDFHHAACGLGFVARVDGRPSHEIVEQGLEILRNLAHRGASGADPDTGDGAGIMLQIPHAFLTRELAAAGIELPAPGHYGLGMVFLPRDDALRGTCERALDLLAQEEGQEVLAWRDVPTEPDRIGKAARELAPVVRQVIIARRGCDEMGFVHRLYLIRRRLHHLVAANGWGDGGCHVVSLSPTTVVYKGLLQGTQVRDFYPELAAAACTSAIALVHSRFSTNTLGSWRLAHPYRYIAHNGEINTLRGNRNWLRAREHQLVEDMFDGDSDRLRPLVEPHVSDSAGFDDAFELLVLGGRSLPHAMMLMVPEAWENDAAMDAERRAFYEYSSSMMEPWDGPAAIAFSDGRIIGATLDRNGLRPARYVETRDGRVALASEDGALPVSPEDILTRWRLQPGKMLVVDTVAHRVLGDHDAKAGVIRSQPWQGWLASGMRRLSDLPKPSASAPTTTDVLAVRRAFGYTQEDLSLLLAPMGRTGKEADGSMGTDTPLAILSTRPQVLFNYFQQLFAQVTNPAIDPLREGLVMSLDMRLGPQGDPLRDRPEHCEQLVLDQPVLVAHEMEQVRELNGNRVKTRVLSLTFPAAEGVLGMSRALDELCAAAVAATLEGMSILVLSDRGIDAEHAAIPSLLATAAVHHRLVRAGIRIATSLVVETGEAREVHHVALLVGYGAAAVHPWLALEAAVELAPDLPASDAEANMVSAIGKGLRKVMSKMGISTLRSYCGAQLFEAVGLDHEMVEEHFTGTATRLGGIGLDGVAREVLERHARAYPHVRVAGSGLDVGGDYQLRAQGEYHQWNTETVVALQRAVRTGDFATFSEYTAHYDGHEARAATLRGLLEFADAEPIPLDDVEPAAEIVKRFSTGAMSMGSISREAHETLAVAMNAIGARSNTGEGGEQADRFIPAVDGTSRRSAIKQVASARFGVTAHYLVNGDMLQIKVAQGSKPGEGGQLPGDKVSEEIARLRHSTPGVGLISPPPHHDIYSIEDLAQLIYDLRHVNPAAAISVKLVSEVGVGTIAAGVVKAQADHVTIAGHDGGTGASPQSSIKHAGLPWELGLAEAQQVLVANGLRGRVRLQVDGHLKTGRDVVVGAMLGADEFGFATAPLVAMGCIMMRVCHLNTCPVGIATQDPELRRRFAGQPEHVVNYFFFLAEEVRHLLAQLGVRRFDDIVGRVEKLRARDLRLSSASDAAASGSSPDATARRNSLKAATLDLSGLLASGQGGPDAPIRHEEYQQHDVDQPIDVAMLTRAKATLRDKSAVTMRLPISNTDRAAGARLSGEIARRFGADGLAPGTVHAEFDGVGGQSFGAWGVRGLELVLHGATNDYAGKGLCGATLVVSPPATAAYPTEASIVVGNVALYGATDGEAYFRGVAGERFAVRNSGAKAVVEGVGDHGCEYMTGGLVVVIGSTGRNFAAGMSGGMAFVYDEDGDFAQRCNMEMVGLESLEQEEDVQVVRDLLERHERWTGSVAARDILEHWHAVVHRFVKVMPHDLRRVRDARARELAAGLV